MVGRWTRANYIKTQLHCTKYACNYIKSTLHMVWFCKVPTGNWACAVSMAVCQPSIMKSFRQFLVNSDHRYFDDIGRRTLYSCVHRLTFCLTMQRQLKL